MRSANDTEAPGQNYGILLARLPTKGQFARVNSREGRSTYRRPYLRRDEQSVEREILVRTMPIEAPLRTFYGFWLRMLDLPGNSRRRP